MSRTPARVLPVRQFPWVLVAGIDFEIRSYDMSISE